MLNDVATMNILSMLVTLDTFHFDCAPFFLIIIVLIGSTLWVSYSYGSFSGVCTSPGANKFFFCTVKRVRWCYLPLGFWFNFPSVSPIVQK